MAAEELAKSEFNSILRNIDRKYEIIDVRWSEEKFFEIKFRTQIQRDNEDFNALCDEWVDLFSEVTNTVWAKKISNTGPKIRFRKQYQCWTQGGKVIQKELLFDARRCKGTLDIKVLTDNPFTRRKNKHIRLGLNVVVKINFVHLHKVETLQPFAFFVHLCQPQPEPPKAAIQPNDRLPQLVAEMVQKGLSASPKVVNPNPPVAEQPKPIDDALSKHDPHTQQLFPANLLETLQDKPVEGMQHPTSQDSIHLPSLQQQTIQLVQNLPMEAIKLELPSHLQQYTQFVVSDMSEQLLMCQPLMLDTSQVIPVSTHTLPSHFVQIHSQNLHNHFTSDSSVGSGRDFKTSSSVAAGLLSVPRCGTPRQALTRLQLFAGEERGFQPSGSPDLNPLVLVGETETILRKALAESGMAYVKATANPEF